MDVKALYDGKFKPLKKVGDPVTYINDNSPQNDNVIGTILFGNYYKVKATCTGKIASINGISDVQNGQVVCTINTPLDGITTSMDGAA